MTDKEMRRAQQAARISSSLDNTLKDLTAFGAPMNGAVEMGVTVFVWQTFQGSIDKFIAALKQCEAAQAIQAESKSATKQ